jgi:hypothetical protein
MNMKWPNLFYWPPEERMTEDLIGNQPSSIRFSGLNQQPASYLLLYEWWLYSSSNTNTETDNRREMKFDLLLNISTEHIEMYLILKDPRILPNWLWRQRAQATSQLRVWPLYTLLLVLVYNNKHFLNGQQSSFYNPKTHHIIKSSKMNNLPSICQFCHLLSFMLCKL